jgi:hypothetical protein
MLDHLAREGMHFTQGARSALAPDVWKQAAAQMADAAGVQPLSAGMLDALHQRLAMSVLATVWFAGQHAPRPSTRIPTSASPTATPDQARGPLQRRLLL